MGESLHACYAGDCREVMASFAPDSVDAVVTDPPYGLTQNKAGGSGDASYNPDSPAGRSRIGTGGGFMGMAWDHGVPGAEFWRAALRVLKPGGHLLAFGGTRTFHRLTCAIEDAGFEIRDCVMWVYGSGFPKSLDVSKAIDAAAGIAREVVGVRTDGRYAYEFNGTANRPTGAAAGTAEAERIGGFVSDKRNITEPATDAAKQWDGWGTALKPAWEPIIVARKALAGTVAENVQRHGTGAINVDACRIDANARPLLEHTGRDGNIYGGGLEGSRAIGETTLGRWPANVIHDGSEEVFALFPESVDGVAVGGLGQASSIFGNAMTRSTAGDHGFGSRGSAARFFYCAKASAEDREEGLERFQRDRVLIGASGHKVNPTTGREVVDLPRANHHPTVKPTALMRYLVRLVTPPGGLVLDPFMGSGSTGKACALEDFRFAGVDLDPAYVEIARRRIEHAARQPKQHGFAFGT